MNEPDEVPVLYAQCTNGHVLTILPGTQLEEDAKTRIENGAVDAICLIARECPGCIEERRDRDRREAQVINDLGCWRHERTGCPDGCTEGLPEVIADSPYQDQVSDWFMPARA